jgi:hypothetical protein
MEPEGLLPYSQDTTTRPCPDPVKSKPPPHLNLRSILISSFKTRLALCSVQTSDVQNLISNVLKVLYSLPMNSLRSGAMGSNL